MRDIETIYIPEIFLKDKNPSFFIVAELFDKGFIKKEALKDFASYILDKEESSQEVQKLCLDILLSRDQIETEEIIKEFVNDKKFNVLQDSLKLVIEYLLFILETDKNSKYQDALEFREIIFEILRNFDFPEKEVEYFLSNIILGNIVNKIKFYLNNIEKI